MPIPGAPLKLTKKEREALESVLDEELEAGLEAHHEIEECFQECFCLYMAEPKSKNKNFPWRNASNIVIPLVAITTDSIVARIVNTIFSVDPFWTVNPLAKEFIELAKPTERFLDTSRKVELELYPEVRSAALEAIICGWSWFKCGWENERFDFQEPQEDGTFRPAEIRRSLPTVKHISLVDIIGQCGVGDVLKGEWIAHRFRLTDSDVKRRKAAGIYENIDEEIFENKEDLSGAPWLVGGGDCCTSESPGKARINQFYEFWWDREIPGRKDETPVNAVFVFHKPTKRIVRSIHNPLTYRRRPFFRIRFAEMMGKKSHGLGLAKQLKYLQDEITTVHNQQVDNATLANTRFFLAKRGVFRNGTRIWPGRFLTSPNPEKDLKPFQLGDVYNSMQQLEGSIMAFAERRSGVSDYALGRESSVVGSRATATGTLAVIQEGNRRFDLNVRDIRDILGNVGQCVLELNQQFRQPGHAIIFQGEDGLAVEAVLDLPPQFIGDRLMVELTASTATINKQVEQQGHMALLGTLIQNMQLGQQAAQIIFNPQAPAEMREHTIKAMAGITEMVRRIAATFNQKDGDSLVPMVIAEGAQNNGIIGQSVGNGTPGLAGPGGANGSVEGVLGLPEGDQGGGVSGAG